MFPFPLFPNSCGTNICVHGVRLPISPTKGLSCWWAQCPRSSGQGSFLLLVYSVGTEASTRVGVAVLQPLMATIPMLRSCHCGTGEENPLGQLSRAEQMCSARAENLTMLFDLWQDSLWPWPLPVMFGWFGAPCYCHVMATFGLRSPWVDTVLHIFFPTEGAIVTEDKTAETVTLWWMC